MAEIADELEAAATLTEADRVRLNRFTEARDAGLTRVEANRFAVSPVDVGLLRKLVAAHCSPQLIVRILL